jgi:hypothetical protein
MSMLNFMPTRATSQPVIVVPTLAPNSTHRAWLRLSRPALTKPMAATVTALDDCTAIVTSAPVARPRRRVWVDLASIRSSAGPAASLRPSVISPMPSRKRPTPPARPPSRGNRFMAYALTIPGTRQGGSQQVAGRHRASSGSGCSITGW